MAKYFKRGTVTFSSARVPAPQKPGFPAHHGGIYRCTTCHHEIAVLKGGACPEAHDLAHPNGEPTSWELTVMAVPKLA